MPGHLSLKYPPPSSLAGSGDEGMIPASTVLVSSLIFQPCIVGRCNDESLSQISPGPHFVHDSAKNAGSPKRDATPAMGKELTSARTHRSAVSLPRLLVP